MFKTYPYLTYIMDILENFYANFISDPLEDISYIAAIIVLTLTATKYFREKKAAEDKYSREKKAAEDKYIAERDADRSRASENLYFEIADTLQTIKGKKDSISRKEMEILDSNGKKKTVHFINMLFNHDFYDSMISSGIINFLDPQLQQSIQNIFRIIKLHNKYLDITTRAPILSAYSVKELSVIKEQNQRYYEWMNDAEDALRDKIPDIMKKLEKYVKAA
ncbi:hypothetical protein CENSYa_0335 [Cenarchaeum symbiosum A]|uniref:DUF4760 domain-containing protein n=1 Tax=Cenarchaeum symbiosum (strain A) TaxID=414004 RepID=A0RUF4_CENSY|nr:hypothetical protein CENSYa_0335 [Cenarchaeum symbiosum A]